jgi:quinol monooxygenase YgiN
MTAIVSGQEKESDNQAYTLQNMMVRIAEIEVEPDYLDEYISILKEEAEASVRLEPGVICIYPMFQKENPTQIRLLEIYADKAAYESHLQSSHFKHYKESTLPMVKSLQLVDMEVIDKEIMTSIFKKMNMD